MHRAKDRLHQVDDGLLLERMKEPDEYMHRRREEVKAIYQVYQSLVTKYCKRGTSYSGDFVAQGAGWVGIESGNEPRKGYFEFIGGRFEPATSPDPAETEQLLAEIRQ